MLRYLAAAIIVLLCSIDAAPAQPRIIDGDTLVLNGITYRLEGIDAPELKQKCADGWLAGVHAADYLRALTRSTTICVAVGRDKYGRTIGDCSSNGYGLSVSMVRAGYAWAYTAYSKRYVVEEVQAESEGLGVHWHGCEKPWKWRKDYGR